MKKLFARKPKPISSTDAKKTYLTFEDMMSTADSLDGYVTIFALRQGQKHKFRGQVDQVELSDLDGEIMFNYLKENHGPGSYDIRLFLRDGNDKAIYFGRVLCDVASGTEKNEIAPSSSYAPGNFNQVFDLAIKLNEINSKQLDKFLETKTSSNGADPMETFNNMLRGIASFLSLAKEMNPAPAPVLSGESNSTLDYIRALGPFAQPIVQKLFGGENNIPVSAPALSEITMPINENTKYVPQAPVVPFNTNHDPESPEPETDELTDAINVFYIQKLKDMVSKNESPEKIAGGIIGMLTSIKFWHDTDPIPDVLADILESLEKQDFPALTKSYTALSSAIGMSPEQSAEVQKLLLAYIQEKGSVNG